MANNDNQEETENKRGTRRASAGLKGLLRRTRFAAARKRMPPPTGRAPAVDEMVHGGGTYILYPGGGFAPAAPVPAPTPIEKQKAEENKKPLPGGIQITGRRSAVTEQVSTEWQEKSKASINETYPLVVRYPTGPVFAYAQVYWDSAEQIMAYGLVEPPMSPDEWALLNKIKDKLEEKLNIDFTAFGKDAQENYLRAHFVEIIDLFNIALNEEQRLKFEYYLFRDFIGLGKIEAIMHDPQIEDISCDGVMVPVYVVHRNPNYGQLRTNVVFENKEELDYFAIKLAQRCGKAISFASPLLDGILPDGSRAQVTFGSDIAKRGSNFTIRKFTEHPFTPVDLIEFGTMNSLAMAYLWIMVEYSHSILIAGATATGKTTFLNAISLFIRPEAKVISIEDTAELQLPHPNWISEVARSGTGEKSYGTVEMFDLLKAALRQRPDYVVVGEVRGQEANVMFQGMATGHPSIGTIHADNVQKVVDRLTTSPINLSPAMLENLDIIIFISRTKLGGKNVRRVTNIVEVRGVDVKESRIIPGVVFMWDPVRDKLVPKDPSVQLDKLAKFRGLKPQSVMEELQRRAYLLEWLREKHVTDYRLFAYYVNQYYVNPQALMSVIMKK